MAALTEEAKLATSAMNRGMRYVEQNGGATTWTNLRELLATGNSIKRDDVRRLMLEDGVKVNFGTKKIESREEHR